MTDQSAFLKVAQAVTKEVSDSAVLPVPTGPLSRPTNIVRFSCRTFEYIFDIYSELEALGEVPYDQTVEDRLLGVLGLSARADEPRDANRIRGWLGDTGELVG